jgi:NADH dehydrogenase
MASWPHVVVVARGFAGLKVCHALARQPLHYQVASGLVSEADVASPLRQMVGEAPNIQILLGEVVAIAPEPPRWC